MEAKDNDVETPPKSRFSDSPDYMSLSDVARATLAAATGGVNLVTPKGVNDTERKGSKCRYSLMALWSLVLENDTEVDDELAKLQRELSDLKAAISLQSKKNFILERDVQDLDNRIALLIQNHMSLDEGQGFRSLNVGVEVKPEVAMKDTKRRQLYGNLFFLLQSEPKYLAALVGCIKPADVDNFLETVVFTIYGNQYDSREERLLLKMLRLVLSSQWKIMPPTELRNLLRANTPVSRIISAYMWRGPGQMYLKNMLSSTVNEIIKGELDLEINPDTIQKSLKEGEGLESGDSEKERGGGSDDSLYIKSLIDERIQELIRITSGCLEKLLLDVETVPYGVRWICKQIRSLAKRNCPELTTDDLCTLVGGVFFLRFINPAITVPESSGLVNAPVKRAQRRTLTLVSKIIQTISNRSAQTREAYMNSLNPLIDSMKGRVRDFLHDLCNVADFDEALEIEQYVALSKKQLRSNITLNDIYTIHQLLQKYRDNVIFDADERLKNCLDELGPEPPVPPPGSENKTFVLELTQGWQNLNPEGTCRLPDTDITKRDILYMDAKSICIQIFRALPSLFQSLEKKSLANRTPENEDEKISLDAQSVIDVACSSRDTVIFRKGMRLKELIAEIDTTYQPGHEDAYRQIMFEEIQNELKNLGNLKEKVKEEILSLEDVRSTLAEQYDHLMGQLKSYRAYLKNVRIQLGVSSGGKGHGRGKSHTHSPLKMTYSHLDRDGTIVKSQVPEFHRSSTFFNFYTPAPGTFAIALHYMGREKPIIEMKLSLDDLLEKQKLGDAVLDLECIQLSATKVLQLLNKHFIKR